MYSRTRCQTSHFGSGLGFCWIPFVCPISCQWGCGTYFDSSVAKFVATCVWNGYQISEMDLFVSSRLALFGECHWWAGATLADKDGSVLFAWHVCQLAMANCMGVTQKHLCSMLGHLPSGVRDPVWPFRIGASMGRSQVSLCDGQKHHMNLDTKLDVPASSPHPTPATIFNSDIIVVYFALRFGELQTRDWAEECVLFFSTFYSSLIGQYPLMSHFKIFGNDGSPSMVPSLVTSTSPIKLWEMQIFSLCPPLSSHRSTESAAPRLRGWVPATCALISPLVIPTHTKAWNHLSLLSYCLSKCHEVFLILESCSPLKVCVVFVLQ